MLVRRTPPLQVHVSAIGAPHVVDPSRLDASARRLYGDAFDELWGELAPVPEENVHVVGDDVLGLACFPTQGHASHHVSYLARDGTLYAGDAAGVRIVPAEHVLPVSPPPDFDLEAWGRTLDEIERREPARLALIHFGVAEDVEAHLSLMREMLATWAETVRDGASEQEFVDAERARLEERVGESGDEWQLAAPLWQRTRPQRYWRKKREQAETAP